MQPQSPNPNFDFMLKDNQPAKGKFALPRLPKAAKIALAVVGGLILLIIISSVLTGNKNGKNQPIINVVARQQEILRVTTLAQNQLKLQDPSTQALAATVSSVLLSEQTQLTTYLAKNGTKVSGTLTADLDKSTDASLQSASENNGLDAAYVSYLQDNLAKYETDLQTAYKTAGPNGKKLLNDAFASTKTLLAAPPLKS